MVPPLPDQFPVLVPTRDADLFYGLWPWAKGPRWALRDPWEFEVEGFGTFLIPKGYITNKASVPSLFWGFPFGYTPDGLCTIAALEHDFLCDLLLGGSEWLTSALGGKLPTAPSPTIIHHHFRSKLLAAGVRRWQAELFFRSVYYFGPGGKLKPSFL